MPHWEFLFIISFPSASTGQWVLPHWGPAQPQLPPGPMCAFVAGRHLGWFRCLVTQRGLCPPHPWLQPDCRVNDYPRPPPALPGAAVSWVSFCGLSWLPQHCSSRGCPRDVLVTGLSCHTCPGLAAHCQIPDVASPQHCPWDVSEASWSHQSCPVANSQRGCGGFELPVAPMWGSLAGLECG